MASQKAIDNSNRLRYIRALERFHKSMISYLSNTQELTKESYIKKIDNAQKLLNRVEEIAIYKGEIQDLQKLVKKMINYKDSDDDIQDIKDNILYNANQLDKSKNARRYKKDKHQKSKFSDWD
jgi:GTP-dependent phosphoenolpyruvate carboxykinase